MQEGQGVARKPPSFSPAPVQAQAPPPQPHGHILPPHCPHECRAVTHSSAAHEFTRKETFICLPGHRFEFIPRQGLAFRKCVIKEFVSSFLNQILVHLPAALLLVTLQAFQP